MSWGIFIYVIFVFFLLKNIRFDFIDTLWVSSGQEDKHMPNKLSKIVYMHNIFHSTYYKGMHI